MFELFNLGFDVNDDGVEDSTIHAVDLDGDGTADALIVDLENDGTPDLVAMDVDGNDQNFDSVEIFSVSEEDGALTLVPIDELGALECFQDSDEVASSTDEELIEIEDRLNYDIQRPSFGASQGTCRASGTNQNYCVFAGF